jgi:glycerol-3-phosphate dehydrogenase
MARRGAEKTIDLILKKLDRKGPKSKTVNVPIYGGEIHNFEELVKDATAQLDRSRTVVRALVHNYGSEYQAVLKYCKEDPTLAEAIGDSTVIKAEVIHAVREEMAQKLEDVVFRRTDLGTGMNPGSRGITNCAELMDRQLGWNQERVRKEQDAVTDIFSCRGPWKIPAPKLRS